MYTLKPINPATTNNPDEGEKTIFVDTTDGKVKTKDGDGNIAEVAFVDETPSTAPLVYKALLRQATSTSAPSANILVNTLPVTPVWSYIGVGTYESQPLLLTDYNVSVLYQSGGNVPGYEKNIYYDLTTDTIKIETSYIGGSAANNVLGFNTFHTAVQIEAYL